MSYAERAHAASVKQRMDWRRQDARDATRGRAAAIDAAKVGGPNSKAAMVNPHPIKGNDREEQA